MTEQFQHFGALVPYSTYFGYFIHWQIQQVYLSRQCKFPVAIGNRIAMGICFGETKEFIEPVDQLFTADMFQLFCDLMYFVPTKMQLFYEKGFPQPVFANDLERYF